MIGLDAYTIPARFFPAVIVLMPVGFAVAAWFPSDMLAWGAVSGFIGTTGLAVLLAEMARDQGRRREPELFKRWGGQPTVQMLRHRDAGVDGLTKHRYHDCLGAIVLGLKMPSEQEEAADVASADGVYMSCTRFLLEQTRDRKRFPLVFKEVVSYGFRRNLWGMKPVGIILAVAAILAITAKVVFVGNKNWDGVDVAGVLVSATLLTIWAVRVTPEWIKPVAFAYARNLLASCEVLRQPRPVEA